MDRRNSRWWQQTSFSPPLPFDFSLPICWWTPGYTLMNQSKSASLLTFHYTYPCNKPCPSNETVCEYFIWSYFKNVNLRNRCRHFPLLVRENKFHEVLRSGSWSCFQVKSIPFTQQNVWHYPGTAGEYYRKAKLEMRKDKQKVH